MNNALDPAFKVCFHGQHDSSLFLGGNISLPVRLEITVIEVAACQAAHLPLQSTDAIPDTLQLRNIFFSDIRIFIQQPEYGTRQEFKVNNPAGDSAQLI
ncbi:hypothetical protein ES707_07465 [subsurface metagenome]